MMENAELLGRLSDGMAHAVEKVGGAIVRVDGRRRRSTSGVVYAPGMVLTASHALEREEGVTVTTGGGRKLAAGFVGRDPSSDLAVLRVDGLDVDAAAPSSETARIGQLALAVGRGEGLRSSLGVVSAVGGPLRTGRGTRLERYVQTDATPYPGLSGGALIDARGGVIGVLVAGFARGVAIAVPAEAAWSSAKALESRGSLRRGYLGILSQAVRLPDAQKAGLEQRNGLLVVGVEEGSPAGSGGILVGDILVKLDGRPVEDTDDLLALLTGERVGASVPVEVVRGGEAKTLRLTIGERR